MGCVENSTSGTQVLGSGFLVLAGKRQAQLRFRGVVPDLKLTAGAWFRVRGSLRAPRVGSGGGTHCRQWFIASDTSPRRKHATSGRKAGSLLRCGYRCSQIGG